MTDDLTKDLKYMLKTEYNQLIDDLMLDDTSKKIFDLKFLEGKTKKEISTSIGLSMSRISERLDIIKVKLEKIAKIKSSLFSLDNAVEFDIIYRCKKLGGKSIEYRNFCIDAFIKKLKNKELADKYYISIDTVKKYKRDRRRELENI